MKIKEYIKIDKVLKSKNYYKDPAMTILHREDGPAIERTSGYKAWYVNGVYIIAVDKKDTVIGRIE